MELPSAPGSKKASTLKTARRNQSLPPEGSGAPTECVGVNRQADGSKRCTFSPRKNSKFVNLWQPGRRAELAQFRKYMPQ